MPYYARVTGSRMKVLIEDNGELCRISEELVGEQLLDFVYYDLKKLNKALDHAYSLAVSVRESDFNIIFKELDTENIYLRFFAELFLDTLLLDRPASKEGFNLLCSRFPNEVAFLQRQKEFKNISYRTISKPFIIGVFSVHAMGLQEFMKSQLEFCIASANEKLYQGLTPTERLFIYEQWRKAQGDQPIYFQKDTFSSRLVISKNIEVGKKYLIENLAEQIQKEKPEISEMTVLTDAWMLMRYEMMKILTEAITIKKCANCGRYFIPDGRSDMEYCTRALADQPGKTCQSVGAMLKHRDKVKSDPVHKEYNKAYKRNHSRVHTGLMSQAEFLVWSDEARDKRDKCLAGELEQERFYKWLNRDRLYKKMDS